MELYESIQKNLSKRDINVVLGNIYDYMTIWKQWYKGNVGNFHYYNVSKVDGQKVNLERKTLGMAKKVCEDFSKLEWSEKTDIKVDTENGTRKLWDILDSPENSFSLNIPVLIEKMYALGTMATVEYFKNGKSVIDYIDGDIILPYKYTNAYISGIITVSQSVEGEGQKKRYKNLITYHEYTNGIYKKLNELYVSKSSNDLGKQIYFNSEFPDIKEEETIITEHPRFQVWKLPIANNLDTNSPMGISIFANSLDTFKAIDIKYDSFSNEFINGKKRLLVDSGVVKKEFKGTDSNNQPIYSSFFDTSDTTFQAIKGMENQPVKEIDFNLRVSEHIEGINAELGYLGAKVGLGNKFYQFNSNGLKTATEVISENSDTYRTKTHHQITIYNCIYDLVASICEMNNIPFKDISITFDDSIIQDKESQLNTGIQLLNAGVISKEKFMKEYLNEEDSEIQEELEKITNNNRVITPEGLDFFNTEE